jgi:PDZ domain-containing protein
MLLGSVLTIAVVSAAFFLPMPYYAITPGSARQVDDLISATSTKTYPPKGRVLLATVTLRSVHPYDFAQRWWDHDIQIVKEQVIRGTTPANQFTKVNLDAMDESKRTAIVVALRRLGYQVPATGKGALVTQVVTGKSYPAEGRINAGDVITSIDGQPVEFVEQAIDLLHKHKPGDQVSLQILSPTGQSRVEQLTMARKDDGTAILGVSLQTDHLDYKLPFDVKIDSGQIGGPSAGLAFTLGVLDELSPGELTGGVQIAATGTIGIDGTVGDVGGVPQKTAAVIASGAKVFLVPPGEYKDAVKRAGKRLKVVQVANLNQAIIALGQLGGDVSALGPAPKPAVQG